MPRNLIKVCFRAGETFEVRLCFINNEGEHTVMKFNSYCLIIDYSYVICYYAVRRDSLRRDASPELFVLLHHFPCSCRFYSSCDLHDSYPSTVKTFTHHMIMTCIYTATFIGEIMGY
jgi:hypothetical protein